MVDAINTSPNPEHGKLSDLLDWNQQDPPDDFEINRNNVIYSYQNNRNPFIDHPEYVNAIWNPVSVQDNTINENAVCIFPLPADNFVGIQFENAVSSTISLSIIDLLGKSVYSETVSIDGNMIKTDLTSIPDGLYILSLRNGEMFVNRKIQVCHK